MMMQYVLTFTFISSLILGVSANIFDFFQGHQQHQHQQQQFNLAKEFTSSKCDKYLCSDTLKCVASKLDCPCPFPDLQLKCILPDKSNYVCFSKDSDRGCDFVKNAYNGLV